MKAFHLEIKVKKKWKSTESKFSFNSSEKFPHSVMIWGAMPSAGVGPLCLSSSKSTQPSTRRFLQHFIILSANKLYGDADFLFQQDFPAQSFKTTTNWFSDHTVFHWPANSPDLNPIDSHLSLDIDSLWDIVKRKMSNTRPNHTD